MNYLTAHLTGAAVFAALLTAPATARYGDIFFIGGGPVDVWSDPANWNNRLPNQYGDIAYVGFTEEARNTFVDFDTNVSDLFVLTITDGMSVRSNGYLLYGDHCWLDISGRNQDEQNENLYHVSSFLLEDSAASVDAWIELLTTANESYFHLDDATIRLTDRLITYPTAGVSGTGTWEFTRDDAQWPSLDNRGYFSGQPGVTVVNQMGSSRFDLDGTDQEEAGRVNAAIGAGPLGATMIFNGTSLTDDFDGEMTINFNGRIEMNMSSNWTLGADGLLRFGTNLQNQAPTLAGSTMTVAGDIEADAPNSVIEANVVLLDTSHTTVGTNDSLTFTGNTIASDALFTVNAGGTLDFAGGTNATANRFVLNGGTMTGANILNQGSFGIRGYGTVNNRVINDGMILADGGTLLVNGTSNDWDGIGNAGNVRSVDGVLHLTDTQDFSFAGDMRAFSYDEIFIDGFGMTLAPASYLYLWEATLRATDPFVLGGDFDAVGNVDMQADITFASTGATVVGDTLNLLQDATVLPGASITGAPGAKIVGGAAGELELAHGATVDVTVVGDGLTHVQRFTAGEATVNGDFVLGGTLNLEAGPPVPLNFDRLIVSDTFEARGVIEVTPLLAYQYQFGDEYDVLDFTTFLDLGYTLELPPLPVDLDWDTSDFETDGILRIDVDTCRADVNDDGWVDFADILLVIGAWDTANASMDVDQSGLVGFSDLLEIIAAWGACP